MVADSVRKILPYSSIAVLIALLYTGYTFYSRKTETDKLDRAAELQKQERDSDSVRRMGGASLKITNFYANPTVVSHGGSSQLCYGVVNAKSLSLKPPVEKVWPSLSRCFDVSPRQNTTYELTAVDEQGHASSLTAAVTVQ